MNTGLVKMGNMYVSDFETARITLDKTAVEQLIKVLTVLKNRL